MVRLDAARTTAEACGRISFLASSRCSRSSIALRLAFHSAIRRRSSSSLSAETSASSRFISSTSGLRRLTSRSFLEPKIFRATREIGEAILCEQFFAEKLNKFCEYAFDLIRGRAAAAQRGTDTTSPQVYLLVILSSKRHLREI